MAQVRVYRNPVQKPACLLRINWQDNHTKMQGSYQIRQITLQLLIVAAQVPQPPQYSMEIAAQADLLSYNFSSLKAPVFGLRRMSAYALAPPPVISSNVFDVFRFQARR